MRDLNTNETLKEKEKKGFLKRREKEFQIGKFGVVFIVMQTANRFTKLTDLMIIQNIIRE